MSLKAFKVDLDVNEFLIVLNPDARPVASKASACVASTQLD
jgi:hypothetical protein